MPSSHLILCRPLLLLPPIPPSIRVFSSESTLHMRWPKYWSFSFSIIPSKEIPGLISFRMDWLDFLAVQGTLQESSPTPQFKSINSSYQTVKWAYFIICKLYFNKIKLLKNTIFYLYPNICLVVKLEDLTTSNKLRCCYQSENVYCTGSQLGLQIIISYFYIFI